MSDASTSTMNCLEGSGWMRMGADEKRLLMPEKAASASGVQANGRAGEVRRVRGAAVIPDEPPVKIGKPQELLQFLGGFLGQGNTSLCWKQQRADCKQVLGRL